ncbi:hypothetical protein GGF42_000234 [Coemansia sp. RSA 2424]|nr:hypothetical protein GGF42_000234 [Coemansia sp. RSA 2424]
MRKSGKPPAITKAVRPPVRGFTDPNSESSNANVAKPLVDDIMIGEAETEQKLVIPVKRNADWMKKAAAAAPPPVAEEKFGLQIMAPTSSRGRQSGASQAARQEEPEEGDSDVDEDTYERVPIEEFGAAMLRGMGWTESKDDKEASVQNGIRPSLLGLGAKPRPKDTLPPERQRGSKRY